jgi:hypothetical protein
MIEAFENAVGSMRVRESITIKIPVIRVIVLKSSATLSIGSSNLELQFSAFLDDNICRPNLYVDGIHHSRFYRLNVGGQVRADR